MSCPLPRCRATGNAKAAASGRIPEFGGSIAHVNGQSTDSQVSDEIKGQGVLFGELQTLLTSHRELLEPYFMKQAVRPDADRFSAWHAAFWTGGTLLFVPRDVEVALPLSHRESPPPSGAPWRERKWWRKERLDQAVLQLMTRCQQRFMWWGFGV